MWKDVRDRVVAMMDDMRMGDITDFRNFVGAVIDEKAFKKISELLEDARANATIIAGGKTRRRRGLLRPADARRRRSRRTTA